jgi:hypothetical protein
MMMSHGMPLILADDYSGLIKVIFFVVFLLVTLIVKALQQQRKETKGPGYRPGPPQDRGELPELRTDAGEPAPGGKRMSVEDVAMAMRRAERERITRQRSGR